MKHPEHDYYEAGYRYEIASSPASARARAEIIRRMLRDEAPEDQTEARRLIEQGRQEARQ